MSFAAVFCLLAVCCFTPGFYFVRRLRWSPLEKLCGSVGLSLILLYLAAWAIYCARPPGGAAAYFVATAICAALGIAARRDIRRLGRDPRVRRVVAGYAFLLLWTLPILAMIRVYSGGAWCVDWQEHFQRALYFLHRFPTDTPIWGNYLLPARPPMMNVLSAFFLGQTRDDFAIHQAVFTFLNLLPFLPCCLMLPALARGRRGRKAVFILTALFAMNPVVIENATYPWTKALGAFYMVLALWFYLAGWRKNEGTRTIAAFAALAAGLLVHYSAGPYCVFLGLHYLVRVFRRRPGKWRELGGIMALCGLLLATWFGWSLAVYGPKATFASNTSVTSSQRYAGGNLAKIEANLADSVFPALLLHPKLMRLYRQPNRAGYVRDAAFSFYQLNLIFAMGLTGGPMVLWLFFKTSARAGPQSRRFWLLLIPFSVLAGVAVIGESNPFGAAHLTLLPMEVLGLALLAAAFPWSRAAAIILLAGCAVDFSLGIFLQARIESLENTPRRTVFTVAFNPADGAPVPGRPTPYSLSPQAFGNWYAKHSYEIGARWLHDSSQRGPADPGIAPFEALVRGRFQTGMADDALFWHGWFSRHGNAMRHLGDLAAGWLDRGLNIPAGALIALFAGLMWVMAGTALRVIAPPGKRLARYAPTGEGGIEPPLG
jgi:hypothetical protein